MNESSVQQPIPIAGLKIGTMAVRDELHFTGGLRAVRLGGGWALGPILRDSVVQFVGIFEEEKIWRRRN
jgi:hypothetical protein